MRTTKQERTEALDHLHEYFKPGDVAHTIVRHVSRSGMSRSISLVATTKDGPYDVSHLVARVLGWQLDRKNGGVKVQGCGMDMGFHLAYQMSHALYPHGFRCSGEKRRCPSNDHSGPGMAARDGRMKHSDSGYAISHRWL